jgi:hypothetical protein
MDDLSGFFAGNSSDWTILSLPAISEIEERVPLGGGRFFHRAVGDTPVLA